MNISLAAWLMASDSRLAMEKYRQIRAMAGACIET